LKFLERDYGVSVPGSLRKTIGRRIMRRNDGLAIGRPIAAAPGPFATARTRKMFASA